MYSVAPNSNRSYILFPCINLVHMIFVTSSSTWGRKFCVSVGRGCMAVNILQEADVAKAHFQLTSVSSIESCADITLKTFFLLLSCISPANNSSSRMKYAFWKLKMMSN